MNATQEVLIVCGWCNKQIGKKQFPASQNMHGESTHGICSECQKRFMGELRDDTLSAQKKVGIGA